MARARGAVAGGGDTLRDSAHGAVRGGAGGAGDDVPARPQRECVGIQGDGGAGKSVREVASSPLAGRGTMRSMVEGDAAGHYDHLLRYTRALTGAAFFAPSQTFLQQGGVMLTR